MANLKTEVARKQNITNFPKNEHFLPTDRHIYMYVSGGNKWSFFRKFDVPCFLVTSVLILRLSSSSTFKFKKQYAIKLQAVSQDPLMTLL